MLTLKEEAGALVLLRGWSHIAGDLLDTARRMPPGDRPESFLRLLELLSDTTRAYLDLGTPF